MIDVIHQAQIATLLKVRIRALCQLHLNPHGQGFIAATSMNFAGKVIGKFRVPVGSSSAE
jgi:hypothetical protein